MKRTEGVKRTMGSLYYCRFLHHTPYSHMSSLCLHEHMHEWLPKLLDRFSVCMPTRDHADSMFAELEW